MIDLAAARRDLLAAFDVGGVQAVLHQGDAHADLMQALVVDILERSAAAPPRTDADPLDVMIWLCPCWDDTAASPRWRITDGDRPGTLSWWDSEDMDDRSGRAVGWHCESAKVVLWLLGRVDSPEPLTWNDEPEAELEVRAEVTRRLRALLVD